MSSLDVSTVCILVHLKTMSSMNGKRCRIIGPFNQTHGAYPTFVHDTKEIVLIKPNNLKTTTDEILEILKSSNHGNRHNMLNKFASKLMKSNYNQLNTKLMMDFNKVLSGNAIYIPNFLSKANDLRLLTHLKAETSNQGKTDWSKHQKFEDPDFSQTFNLIIEYISSYFAVDVYASRLNYYSCGEQWKPYHHDSHAYLKNKNVKEDFV